MCAPGGVQVLNPLPLRHFGLLQKNLHPTQRPAPLRGADWFFDFDTRAAPWPRSLQPSGPPYRVNFWSLKLHAPDPDPVLPATALQPCKSLGPGDRLHRMNPPQGRSLRAMALNPRQTRIDAETSTAFFCRHLRKGQRVFLPSPKSHKNKHAVPRDGVQIHSD